MNYKFYSTKKEPLYPTSVKWLINQLSNISIRMRNKELLVDKSLKEDLRLVLKELNESLNELLSSGDKRKK
jgi:hypothetical protein